MTRPRTSPTQRIPSRYARGKYALQSRHARYSSAGTDNLPSYLASVFPEYRHDKGMMESLVRAMYYWQKKHKTDTVLTPVQLRNPANGVFAGILY